MQIVRCSQPTSEDLKFEGPERDACGGAEWNDWSMSLSSDLAIN